MNYLNAHLLAVQRSFTNVCICASFMDNLLLMCIHFTWLAYFLCSAIRMFSFGHSLCLNFAGKTSFFFVNVFWSCLNESFILEMQTAVWQRHVHRYRYRYRCGYGYRYEYECECEYWDTSTQIQIHPRHVNGHGKHEKSPAFRPSANPSTDRKFNHKIW